MKLGWTLVGIGIFFGLFWLSYAILFIVDQEYWVLFRPRFLVFLIPAVLPLFFGIRRIRKIERKN